MQCIYCANFDFNRGINQNSWKFKANVLIISKSWIRKHMRVLSLRWHLEIGNFPNTATAQRYHCPTSAPLNRVEEAEPWRIQCRASYCASSSKIWGGNREIWGRCAFFFSELRDHAGTQWSCTCKDQSQRPWVGSWESIRHIPDRQNVQTGWTVRAVDTEFAGQLVLGGRSWWSTSMWMLGLSNFSASALDNITSTTAFFSWGNRTRLKRSQGDLLRSLLYFSTSDHPNLASNIIRDSWADICATTSSKADPKELPDE